MVARNKKYILYISVSVFLVLAIGLIFFNSRQNEKETTKKLDAATRKRVMDYYSSPESSGKSLGSSGGPMTQEDQKASSELLLDTYSKKLAEQDGKTVTNYYIVIVSAHTLGKKDLAEKYFNDLKKLSVISSEEKNKEDVLTQLEELLQDGAQ